MQCAKKAVANDASVGACCVQLQLGNAAFGQRYCN
jgi:hypothetical protein